jgi:putative membrane protein
MSMLIRWLVSASAIMLSAYIISGVEIASFFTALWLSLVLGLINAIIRPILIILTLPINIISLGLFTLVINASLVLLASNLVKGFSVNGFWYALLFSITTSVISYMLNAFVKD